MFECAAKAERDQHQGDDPGHRLDAATVEQAVDFLDAGLDRVAALHVGEHVMQAGTLKCHRHHRAGDRAREQRRNGRHLLQCQQQHQRSGQQRDP